MDLVKALKQAIKETVSSKEVEEVIRMGGIVFPYPRRGEVRINGGRAKKATKEAIKLAQQFVKESKQPKA